jgi:hypothetical protein
MGTRPIGRYKCPKCAAPVTPNNPTRVGARLYCSHCWYLYPSLEEQLEIDARKVPPT